MTGRRVTSLCLVAVLCLAVATVSGATAGHGGPDDRSPPAPAPATTTTTTVGNGTTAAATTTPPADVSLSARVEQSGREATLVVELRNAGRGDSVAPVVQVGSVPAGWQVVGQESADGVWRDSTREWAWLNVSPGETVTARLFLRATENTSDGGTIELAVVDADDNTDTATASVSAPGGDENRFLGLGVDRLLVAALVAVAALSALGAYFRRRWAGPPSDDS